MRARELAPCPGPLLLRTSASPFSLSFLSSARILIDCCDPLPPGYCCPPCCRMISQKLALMIPERIISLSLLSTFSGQGGIVSKLPSAKGLVRMAMYVRLWRKQATSTCSTCEFCIRMHLRVWWGGVRRHFEFAGDSAGGSVCAYTRMRGSVRRRSPAHGDARGRV